MKRLAILDFCGTIYSNQSTRDVSYFFFFNNGYNTLNKIFRKKLFSVFFQIFFILFVPKEKQLKTIRKYLDELPGEINYSLLDKYNNYEVIISSAGIYELIEEFCRKYLNRKLTIIQAPELIGKSFLRKIKDFIINPHTGKIKKKKLKKILNFKDYQEIVFETDSKNDFEVSKLDLNYIEIPSYERFK